MRKIDLGAWPVAVALASVYALTACSNIEVKRESPEAAVATLIKIYGAKKYELLDQVVDSTIVRREKRESACLGDIIASSLCLSEALAHMKAGGDRASIPRCTDATSCTCGAQGSAEAAKAGAFTSSEMHGALAVAGLDPKACTLKDVRELQRVDDVGDAMPFWTRYACKDVPENATFALVQVTCGDDAPLGFVARKTADGWRFYDIEAGSKGDLKMAASSKTAREDQKRKKERLNKDLK